MLFRSNLEFQDDDDIQKNVASGVEILFESDDIKTAALDTVRWWDNRHAAIPDTFRKLCAFKVWLITPQRVRPDGYLPLEHACVYEWKYDSGWPLPGEW